MQIEGKKGSMDQPVAKKKRLEDRAPLLVLLIGLVLTGLGSWGARQNVLEHDRLRFELSIEAVEKNLRERLDLYLGVAWAAVGLFQSNGLDVSPEEFRMFRLAADWGERNRGLAGLLFIQKVNRGDLADFHAKHRVNNPEFQVCLLYTSPSPRGRTRSRMPSSA